MADSNIKRIPYPFLVTQVVNEDGSIEWEAEAIDLPGCVSGADTYEELGDLMAGAQQDWIETAKERGMDLPEPCTSAEYSGKLTLRLAPSMHRRMALLAKISRVSLNSYIAHALSYDAGWQSGRRGGHIYATFNIQQPSANQPDSTAFPLMDRRRYGSLFLGVSSDER